MVTFPSVLFASACYMHACQEKNVDLHVYAISNTCVQAQRKIRLRIKKVSNIKLTADRKDLSSPKLTARNSRGAV